MRYSAYISPKIGLFTPVGFWIKNVSDIVHFQLNVDFLEENPWAYPLKLSRRNIKVGTVLVS